MVYSLKVIYNKETVLPCYYIVLADNLLHTMHFHNSGKNTSRACIL